MTTGIIGYLTARGLGSMTHDLRVHLGIQHQMVPVDHGWAYVPEWATGNEIYLDQLHVQKEDLEIWKECFGIDTVVSIETSYGDRTFEWAKELGMRTILLPMWEHFNPHLPAYRNVDSYICTSFACYQEVPFDNRRYLPWPVDTDEFKFQQRTGPAKTFLICAGSGGLNGRKGVAEGINGFLRARLANPDIRLIVRSQVPLDTILSEGMMNLINRDDVQDAVVTYGPTATRAEQYLDGDVFIGCSKYEGHFLTGLEAMACGLPVITTNAVPMNELAHSKDLFVKVASKEKAGTVNPHCFANIVDIHDLAAKISWCATHDMDDISYDNRLTVNKEFSWDILRDRWKKVLL